MFTLRKFTQDDIVQGVALSQQGQWPHRIADWQLAFETGEGVSSIIDGRLAATGFSWCWDSLSASIGMMIVDLRYQRQGIGQAIMQTMLSSLKGKRIKLSATASGQGLYEKLDFCVSGGLTQYQIACLLAVKAAALPDGVTLSLAEDEDLLQLSRLEQAATCILRKRLFEWLIAGPGVVCLSEPAGRLSGFGSCRQFGRGYVIGPVVASKKEDAWLLISHLLTGLNRQFVRIDTSCQASLGPGLSAYGFAVADTPVLMARGNPYMLPA